jgi:hypothetical protein
LGKKGRRGFFTLSKEDRLKKDKVIKRKVLSRRSSTANFLKKRVLLADERLKLH